jgi:uncharacterized protein YgbK (DUF1537 family)
MLLGCIGDDFTGSSDLANTLVKSGMATTQYCGVPQGRADAGVEAGVVALRLSRSRLRRWTGCVNKAAASSSSNIVPLSIPRRRAISAPWQRRW